MIRRLATKLANIVWWKESELGGHKLASKLQEAMESRAMFNSLDEQIERTEGGRPSASAQLVRLVGIVILSVVAFGGLYLAIVALE